MTPATVLQDLLNGKPLRNLNPVELDLLVSPRLPELYQASLSAITAHAAGTPVQMAERYLATRSVDAKVLKAQTKALHLFFGFCHETSLDPFDLPDACVDRFLLAFQDRYAPMSLRNLLVHIGGFYAWMRITHATYNPFDRSIPDQLTLSPGPQSVPSSAQISVLRAKASPTLKLVIDLVALCGLRSQDLPFVQIQSGHFSCPPSGHSGPLPNADYQLDPELCTPLAAFSTANIAASLRARGQRLQKKGALSEVFSLLDLRRYFALTLLGSTQDQQVLAARLAIPDLPRLRKFYSSLGITLEGSPS